MTSPKYQDEEKEPDQYGLEEVRKYFTAGKKLIRNEGSRFAFQEHGKNFWLFVDGRQYTCSELMTDLVKILCAERKLSNVCGLSEEHDSLLLDLLNHGSLYLSD